MVSDRTVKALYTSAFIAGATMGGGPAAGAAAAAFLQTELGKSAMKDFVKHTTKKGDVRKTARRAYASSDKPKRKASAYSKRYGRAFKKLAPKYKKKNGQWKKDGFKRCGAAARKEAKRS